MSKKISGEQESDNAYSNTLLLANKNLELQIIEIKKLENKKTGGAKIGQFIPMG